MRPLLFSLSLLFLSQICTAQITLETQNGDEGSVEIFAINSTGIPYTVLIKYTQINNLSSSAGSSPFVVARPGRSKVVTLKRVNDTQSTNMGYTYSYMKGDYSRKSKNDAVYLIPLPEGTIATGHRMTHIQNQLKPKETNDAYVGVSFSFGLPTEIVAPRKGVVSEISMDKYPDKNNLAFDSSENYIELFHEDGSITKIMVLSPGTEKVKLGQVVYPGDVLAESAGEDYNSGFHVRITNMKPAKENNTELKYHMSPMKFVSEKGESDLSKSEELMVIHPKEVIVAEMNKKEKKSYEESNQD